MSAKSTPEPFTIAVPEEVLNDLHQRLSLTRWPDEVPESGWQYGANLSYLKELISYWQHEYDWRTQERLLNSFPQYRIQLDDIDLHYIHVQGVGSDPLPLLISHGWPGSVYEFIKIIGPLTDPERHGGDPRDAFTVVAPSLPGYGFSHVPNQRRLSVEDMADLFARLMTESLGFPRFAAQGGDWGALITGRLGFVYPEQVVGIHLNMVPVAPHPSDRTDLTPEEEAFIKESKFFTAEETGYQWIQGTKPQTLAFGLNDSPAGLAAWITEKFYTWTDCHGDIESRVSKDDLLTNIMRGMRHGGWGLERRSMPQLLWLLFRVRSPALPVSGWQGCATFSTGQSCHPAGILLRLRNPKPWSKIFELSTGACARIPSLHLLGHPSESAYTFAPVFEPLFRYSFSIYGTVLRPGSRSSRL
jgi:microsomal epoxide hydrolase